MLRQALARHGLAPTKRFGQHFLVSTKVVQAIVQAAASPAGVLEVGPGPGVLTRPLSELSERLVALEVDAGFAAMLADTAPRAEVRRADALQVDLAAVLAELPEPRALVSNMPYNITGPLLTAFAGVRGLYARAVLMMQREVGVRVLAQPGSRERGSLSVFLQAQFQISKVVAAPRSAFLPPPKVESVVLLFEPKPTGLDEATEERFFRLVRAGFTQPRKTLHNNLVAGLRLEREEAARRIAAVGLEPSVRPHQLTMDAWYRLAALP